MLTPELVIDSSLSPAEHEQAAWEHWGSALTRALTTTRRPDWARSTMAWHIWRATHENLYGTPANRTWRNLSPRDAQWLGNPSWKAPDL